MAQPDYLVCMECESPTYVFDWQEGRVVEVVCPVCGNDDPANFATEEEIEEMSTRESEEHEEE